MAIVIQKANNGFFLFEDTRGQSYVVTEQKKIAAAVDALLALMEAQNKPTQDEDAGDGL